jgi:predicted nuclease with TOPRIM domain
MAPSKAIKRKDKIIEDQRKEIEDLKAQLSQSCPRTESAALTATEGSSTGENLAKNFETLKVSTDRLNEKLKSKRMLIVELQTQLQELKSASPWGSEILNPKNLTPTDSEDISLQLRHLIGVLSLLSQEKISAKTNKVAHIAELVDDLILHYKWPFRNEERFNAMKVIGTNLKAMGFPMAMHTISFDNKEMMEKELEWLLKIQNK